jgi:hypothetical protein
MSSIAVATASQSREVPPQSLRVSPLGGVLGSARRDRVGAVVERNERKVVKVAATLIQDELDALEGLVQA